MVRPPPRSPAAFLRRHGVTFVLLLGVLVRLLYLSGTTHDARGRDMHGHVYYLHAMERRLAIPPAAEGWETFQPPLYYALGGMALRAMRIAGVEESGTLRGLQWLSLLLSLVTLLAAAGIAGTLWPLARDKGTRVLFLAMIAVLPGLVFLSATINNDTLVQCLSFVFLFFLLSWWKRGDRLEWVAACIAIALALLTKANGLLLIPVAFTCLLLRPSTPRRERLRLAAVGTALLVMLTLWYPLLRFTRDDDMRRIAGETANPAVLMIPNIRHLRPDIALHNTPGDFLTFNPIAFIPDAYNDPWSSERRREHLWEWLYRSAFLDEQHHGEARLPLARGMLALGLVPLLLVPLGILIARRKRRHFFLPLLTVLVALAAGQLVLRILAPFPSSQDFRYSTLLAVPLLAFALEGMFSLPKIPRLLCMGTWWGLVALCFLFGGSFAFSAV